MSNPKTSMFQWSFGSFPTGSNKARDLKIGMLVHHIGVYHIYSVFEEKKIKNEEKSKFFFLQKFNFLETCFDKTKILKI